jgi:hypothetical protein
MAGGHPDGRVVSKRRMTPTHQAVNFLLSGEIMSEDNKTLGERG